jgi:hypothetical protein
MLDAGYLFASGAPGPSVQKGIAQACRPLSDHAAEPVQWSRALRGSLFVIRRSHTLAESGPAWNAEAICRSIVATDCRPVLQPNQ